MASRFQSLLTPWTAMSMYHRILTSIGVVGIGLASYAMYYRMRETSNKFNSYTTSEDAINGMNLSGKYAIVTGSNTGIGKETVKILYKQGCKVIMACRNIEAANKAQNDIVNSLKDSPGNGMIDIIKLDLSSLQSVRDFATNYSKKYGTIHYLINNAGIMALPSYKQSIEGYELQFAVNHLGHFYLTNLLMPLIIKDKARVITVASSAHSGTNYEQYEQFVTQGIKNNNGPLPENYDAWINYGISKTSNIFFARELHKRYSKNGVVAVSCHPGWVAGSNLTRNISPKLSDIPAMIKMFGSLHFFVDNFKSISQGAATSLRCVSDDQIKGGHYYHNCRSGRDEGKLQGAAVMRQYDNEQDSMELRLWELSETLITQKGFQLTL